VPFPEDVGYVGGADFARSRDHASSIGEENMKIDIDSMSYEELLKLNHRIVERLKFLDSMRTHHEMMQFSPGDQVCFQPSGRDKQFGTLVKFNRKTVTVITGSGERWNVPPRLLRKVKDVKDNKNSQGKIIDLPER